MFISSRIASSSSIGTQRVTNVCIHFRNCCEEKNNYLMIVSLLYYRSQISEISHHLKLGYYLTKRKMPG
ncbi:putative HPT domain superfamily protein [Helianthus annuus]|nr:putative HPT domain superfamily protein [Helianthus annuus]